MADYKGKITNKVTQLVKAVFKQPAGKAPKVVSGGDLRAKKSSK